jgi:hypothetical protein
MTRPDVSGRIGHLGLLLGKTQGLRRVAAPASTGASRERVAGDG